MKTILQLLTDSKQPLSKEIHSDTEWKVETVDLTQSDVDYRKVLEKVFAADSVQVW
jgi:hypothetical protein